MSTTSRTIAATPEQVWSVLADGWLYPLFVVGAARMRDVDEFLDQLTNSMTALVEENRRLKEQAGSGAMIGAPDLDEVSRQADENIRRARDEGLCALGLRFTADGAVPAERTSTASPARWVRKPAAICDRPALCTHTNSTVGRLRRATSAWPSSWSTSEAKNKAAARTATRKRLIQPSAGAPMSRVRSERVMIRESPRSIGQGSGYGP